MIDRDQDDVFEPVPLVSRCCVPGCLRSATGLYCSVHLAQLARLDDSDEPRVEREDTPP
jgi:hypothetical protein